ncbi:Uncharacterised protein [Actinobacillus pleuropneumoniae]|nr:Uncharacterised protein [Actinobacillus pleuropneumoniae]
MIIVLDGSIMQWVMEQPILVMIDQKVDLIIKFLVGHKLLKTVIPNHHHLDTQ